MKTRTRCAGTARSRTAGLQVADSARTRHHAGMATAETIAADAAALRESHARALRLDVVELAMRGAECHDPEVILGIALAQCGRR